MYTDDDLILYVYRDGLDAATLAAEPSAPYPQREDLAKVARFDHVHPPALR